MSVYNGERYLDEAVRSILNQTFTDFEFLIIDDASTDRTSEILHTYTDPRMKIVLNETNMGLTRSLNRGLGLAKGEYIARMDADDISLPERLQVQVSFMEKNSRVSVCGCWVKLLGIHWNSIQKFPIGDEEIKCNHLFNCQIAHPSAVIRKEILDNEHLSYNADFKKSQDYEFWVRISHNHSFENIGRVLVHRRIHPDAISQHSFSDQQSYANMVRKCQIEDIFKINPEKSELKIHYSLSNLDFFPSKEYLLAVNSWLLKLKSTNKTRKVFADSVMSVIVSEKWFLACKGTTKLGLWTWKKFWSSPLSEEVRISIPIQWYFLMLCALKIDLKSLRRFYL